ncbi:MAG: zinc ABC transporter substrate-binding protein [Clostridia bacterium]|nr:zinc ABC transporter substrate-binding protein [Clostridia bacterium]
MKIIHSKKILKNIFIALMCYVLTAVFSGCSNTEIQNDKLNIVTVIFPQYDFVRAVVGDRANVSMIMKPGAEIHGFEPSLSDIRAISDADVVIYNGGESDKWIEDVIMSVSSKDIQTIRLMDYVELLEEEHITGSSHTHIHNHAHRHTEKDHEECESYMGIDEHIWTSPKNAIKMIDAICDLVVEADSANKNEYLSNTQKYKNEISEIDSKISRVCQDAEKNMIIVGDRFPFLYLAKEYGLEYLAAFPGCSPETDANPSVIINIINTMKNEKIKTVLCTELSDKKMARTISNETDSQIRTLHSCQNISADDFEAGVSYVDLMNENIKTLKEALE